MPLCPSELPYLLPRLQGMVPHDVIRQLACLSQFQDFQRHAHSGMNTRWRLAHFLGQCAHESGGFKHRVENLNYSAEQLQKTFPTYFLNPEIALLYAHHPEKIASRVYANRMGNGDEASMDGFRFRGRGYLQLTGRDNYLHFGFCAQQDFLENPDWVAAQYPLISAIFFFCTRSIWSICDKGTDHNTHQQITRLINGGRHGLHDRYDWVQRFLKRLNRGGTMGQ